MFTELPRNIEATHYICEHEVSLTALPQSSPISAVTCRSVYKAYNCCAKLHWRSLNYMTFQVNKLDVCLTHIRKAK
jgi:hypothetical protein